MFSAALGLLETCIKSFTSANMLQEQVGHLDMSVAHVTRGALTGLIACSAVTLLVRVTVLYSILVCVV